MKVVGKKSDRVLLFDFAEPMPDIPVKPKRYRSEEATEKAAKTRSERLTPRERKFCMEYVRTGNARNSVMAAGYNVSNLNSAGACASDLLRAPKIQQEIHRLQQADESVAIATSAEVMAFFTKMMNGEMSDQFGLEISAADKLKAACELAKRTVDIDNKLRMKQEGVADNCITIKVDWQQ